MASLITGDASAFAAAPTSGGKLAGLDLSFADSMRIREAGRQSRQLLAALQTAKVARAEMRPKTATLTFNGHAVYGR